MSTSYVNDADLAAIVYSLTAIGGHLSAAVARPDTVALANAPGVTGCVVTIAARRVVVEVQLRAATFAARQTLLDTLWRRLGGTLEFRSDDVPGRLLRVQLDDAQASYAPSPSPFAYPMATVTLVFDAKDPYWSDREPLPFALSTARKGIPVGTATSALLFELYGASPSVVDPVIVVRSHTGAAVMTFTLTGTIALDDSVVIDASRQTIDRYVAGVLQTGVDNGLGMLAAGSRFPILSPEDASADGTAWGTVELTATSGTPTGVCVATRRWQ